jgi:hypothetical protein
LIVGYGFMEHGFAKLARGLDAFVESGDYPGKANTIHPTTPQSSSPSTARYRALALHALLEQAILLVLG